MCIYMCVCVCVCVVYNRLIDIWTEREREEGGWGGAQGGRGEGEVKSIV